MVVGERRRNTKQDSPCSKIHLQHSPSKGHWLHYTLHPDIYVIETNAQPSSCKHDTSPSITIYTAEWPLTNHCTACTATEKPDTVKLLKYILYGDASFTIWHKRKRIRKVILTIFSSAYFLPSHSNAAC